MKICFPIRTTLELIFIMTIAIPTLSSDGWVTDPELTAVHAFANFVENRHNDSLFFQDKTVSFLHILAKYNRDPNGLVSACQKTLTNYYQRLGFTNLNITMTYTDTNDGRYTINFAMVGYKDDTYVDISRAFIVNPGTAAVEFINNYG